MNWRRGILVALAVSWVGGVSAAMVMFHSRHTLSLNIAPPIEVEAWDKRQPASESRSGRRMFHLLSSECGCSKNVLRALVNRKPAAYWNETVIVLLPTQGRSAEQDREMREMTQSLEALKYQVRFVDKETKLPTQGVPAVVAFVDGRNVYAGGYLKTRVTAVSELGLETFLSEIDKTGGAKARPIFGCSVAKGIRQAQKPEEWLEIAAAKVWE